MYSKAFSKGAHRQPQITENSLSEKDAPFNNANDNSSLPILQNDSILREEKIQLLPPKTKTRKKTHKHDRKSTEKPQPDPLARFQIYHNVNPEKKRLENSYEDYFFYEILDDDSYALFLRLTQEYISKRINDKIMRLYNSLRRQIGETITHGMKQVHIYNDVIQKVVNKTLSKAARKKGCCEKCCSCFFKPKQKNNLKEEHHMRDVCENINSEVSGFVEETIAKFTDEGIEEICPVNTEETSNFAKQKSKVFFKKKGIEELLRGEVENYSKYFNIETIIEKQENTLETQKRKLNRLDDTKELNECIICMEKQRNMIFFPCYHLICCEECGNMKVKEECPECKKKIERKMLTN